MVSYSYRQTSSQYSFLRYYDNIITIRAFFLHNFSGMKRTCWTTGSWRSCLSLEVVSSIPAGSMIIYRVYMRFPVPKHQNQTKQICISPAQFKIKTHRCWNWHLCIPDGLSVVQCSLGHVIGVAFFTQFQWHEANVLDSGQLAELPQSGGREFDPLRVHDNLSVPLWVDMRLPVPEHQYQTKQIYIEPKWIHRPCLLYFTTFSRTGSLCWKTLSPMDLTSIECLM